MARRGRGGGVQGDEKPVEVAVVVPLSREPALFVETVASVLRQVSPPGFRIVAVLHGRAYRQSQDAATALARAQAPRLALLRQAAGGATAAWNAGLGFARAAWPGLRAFALLEEGDRLGPHALRRAWEALADAPAAGWAHGDADRLGRRGGGSASGEHSPLQHLTGQVAEATLLLRREIFDAGLAFDAALPPGAALWDLQLAAIARGFGGVFVPHAGLFRRPRPEPEAPPMPPRHPALFAPRAILAREAVEAPRLLLAGAEQGAFCLDPDRAPGPLPRADALARLAAGLADPGARHAPAVLAFGGKEAFATLRRAGLLRGLLAVAERLLAAGPAVGVSLSAGPEIALRPAPPPADPALLLLRPEALANPAARAAKQGLSVTLPGAARQGEAAVIAETWAAGLPAALAALPPRPWRRDLRGPRAQAAARAARAIGAWPLLPLAPDPARRDIAFLLPRFGLGGVERATARLAAALRARGWRTHLLLTGRDAMDPPPEGAFDSLLLPGGAEEEALPGLLAPMHAVLTTHSAEGLALAPRLKRLGVATAAGLHVMEPAALGTPHEVLAAAASLDLVVCHSRRLARWCAAAGVPEARVLAVENAPGHDPDPARIAAALAARRARAGGPLRALVLGRLDRQKAPERIAALVGATEGRVAWRIVGRAELDAAPELPLPVEPPVGDAAALDALYAAADVLVLASRYEGVPLSVLEAQRMGCVPVAPRVGALEEAVADGEDGVLVPDGEDAQVVARLAEALLSLAADPPRLLRLAEAAAARGAARSWAPAAAALAAALAEPGRSW
jgi:glycosyltransferase involved in cell wall biosynthesis